MKKIVDSVTDVSPLSTTIPARELSIFVNSGNVTANRVRVTINADRGISDLKIDSIEPYKIINGNIGENNVIIEIDRIIADQEIKIRVKSSQAICKRKTQHEEPINLDTFQNCLTHRQRVFLDHYYFFPHWNSDV